jgi:hypothetical protein
MHVRDGELERASESLADFVLGQAQQTATAVGFGWVESPTAPSTFDDVLDAYFQSCETRKPYPVASVGSGTSIYRHFAFQRGEMVASRSQLGLLA